MGIVPIPGSTIRCSAGHPNTSCPRTPPPFRHLVSLGSPQYSPDFECCLSCVQTSTVTSVPAPAQLWNYMCHPPGHHLKPCHLCLFISCQFLPHQFLSWHLFSAYFSLLPAVRCWNDGENETHRATFHPQLCPGSLLQGLFVNLLGCCQDPQWGSFWCAALWWAPLWVEGIPCLRLCLLLAAWEEAESG